MTKLRKRLILQAQFKFLIIPAIFFGGVLFSQYAFAAESATVCFKQACFHAEVARSSTEKKQGLMQRLELAENAGMFFVYAAEGRPIFWMKNMRIPLDFIWLNTQQKIVAIHENVPPCSVSDCPPFESHSPVQYILEIRAGAIRAHQIKVGDAATIKWGEKL